MIVIYDREHDFDVILGQVVPCRKLRWIGRKYSNDVAQQVESPGKLTIFVVRHDFHVGWKLHYTVTVKHMDAAIGAFLVLLLVNYSDILHRVVLHSYRML